MTRLTITPGICGFDAVIEEEQITRRKIKVLVKSHCERVIRFGESSAQLDAMEVFRACIRSEVYRQASIQGLYSTCPIPLSVLKGMETEAGMTLARDIFIHLEASEHNQLSKK